MSQKTNCWEVKKCGREPGGSRVDRLGVCPAATERRLDGVHGGTNAGRACWVVAGTLCDGQLQGTYAKKAASCSTCDFYRAVAREQSPDFSLSAVLLRKLRGTA